MTEDQLASIYAYLQTNPDPAALAAAQAEYGVSNADLAAAMQYGAAQAGEPVVGPYGYDERPTVSPGTTSQGYSRNYSPQEIETIRGTWIQNRDNPQEAMRLMSQYGVSVNDLALAMGDSAQGYQNYFLQAGAEPTFGGMSNQASAGDRAYIDWMLRQPNPTGQGTMADVYRRQGIDPYTDPRVITQARDEQARLERRNAMRAEAGAEPITAAWARTQTTGGGAGGGGTGGGGTGGGGGGGGTGGGGGAGGGGGGGGAGGGGGGIGFDGQTPTDQVSPRIQAIRDWYNANAGRTDAEAQRDLNRFLATSGYSAREINQALPQFSIYTLQDAMRTAINDVAQQTPFAPAVPRAINESYTSVAAQLAPTAASRQQEIQNWLAAYADKGTQADLDRFLASGYTAQEINQAAPQYPVGDLQRAIDAARQAYPTAAYEAALGRYQRGFQPGGQFVGNVSPYALVAQQMQQFQNPYADALANISMGGYTPSLYDVLLQDVVEQSGGGAGGGGGVEPDIRPGVGGDAGGGGGESGVSAEGEANAGGPAPGTGDGPDNYMGGLITKVFGHDPAGPDEGQINIQRGEYVIKKSSVDKYGKGLLDMINEGKIPAKKIKSLLD